MERNCKSCKKFLSCKYYVPFPEQGCSEFILRPKKLVLLHKYLETGHTSIVAFSDYLDDLNNVKVSYPHFGSSRHIFVIYNNISSKRVHGVPLNFIKDICLINICKNVAKFLAVGEYAMLKKSYFKASSWFEKAKNFASFGAEIILNY